MPLYEYYCSTCQSTFELLRQSTKADTPTSCPECKSETPQRILSLFATSVKSESNQASSVAAGPSGANTMSGGGCCGGACGCHH